MTVGSPDYGVIKGQTNETQDTDVLELASRLGGIAAVNRTGQQIASIKDSICYGSGMWFSSGNGGYILPSTKYSPFNRPQLKIVTGTTSTDSGQVNLLGVPFSPSTAGVNVLLGGVSAGLNIEILFTGSLGSTTYVSGLLLNPGAQTISCYNQSGGWTNIGTFLIPIGIYYPFSAKYTFNLTTGKYGYLFFGSEQIINLEQYSFQSYASSSYNSWQINAIALNTGNAQSTMYIQDIILTVNEVV